MTIGTNIAKYFCNNDATEKNCDTKLKIPEDWRQLVFRLVSCAKDAYAMKPVL